MPELTYAEVKSWQPLIGAASGFMALMIAALWNFHLNRRRDAHLRSEEVKSVAAALYGEIILLRGELARLAKTVATIALAQGTSPSSTRKFDKYFLEQNTLPEAHLYKALAASCRASGTERPREYCNTGSAARSVADSRMSCRQIWPALLDLAYGRLGEAEHIGRWRI